MNLTDLKIETNPSPKRHGQSAGVIPVGVTVTHIPSGLTASCVSLRSQMKNRDVAMAMIEAGLIHLEVVR